MCSCNYCPHDIFFYNFTNTKMINCKVFKLFFFFNIYFTFSNRYLLRDMASSVQGIDLPEKRLLEILEIANDWALSNGRTQFVTNDDY